MKNYKVVLDVVLLASLTLLSLVAILPKTIAMPTAMQMVLLAIVLGLIAAFLTFLWREQPTDEREAHNQALASRSAYVVGAIILIFALIIESLRHKLDPAIPIALLAMIATKVIIQKIKDDN